MTKKPVVIGWGKTHRRKMLNKLIARKVSPLRIARADRAVNRDLAKVINP